jgi:hypothetical protein
MSLAPSPVDTTRAPMTALRIISLAYSVGQMMGWDAMSDVWHQSPWLTLPEWSARLDQVLLWETIKNRYNMYVAGREPAYPRLCLLQGMSSSLAISLADRLPVVVSDHYLQSLASLKSDARLVAIFAPILSQLCRAEVEAQTSALDVKPLLEAWPPIVADFDQWKLEDKFFSSKSPVRTD